MRPADPGAWIYFLRLFLKNYFLSARTYMKLQSITY